MGEVRNKLDYIANHIIPVNGNYYVVHAGKPGRYRLLYHTESGSVPVQNFKPEDVLEVEVNLIDRTARLKLT